MTTMTVTMEMTTKKEEVPVNNKIIHQIKIDRVQVRHIEAVIWMKQEVIIRDAPYDCPGMAIQFPNAESTVIGFELNPEGGCN